MENKYLVFFLFNSQLSSSIPLSSKLKDFSSLALSHHCPKISVIHILVRLRPLLLPGLGQPHSALPSFPRTTWTGQATQREGRDSPCMCSSLMELTWRKFHCSERIKPHSKTHLSGWIILCPSPQEIWHFSLCHPLCLKTLNGSLLPKGSSSNLYSSVFKVLHNLFPAHFLTSFLSPLLCNHPP